LFDDVKSALLSKQKYDDDVEPESADRGNEYSLKDNNDAKTD
ncbi:hypothetical protein Tco_1277237, partial [Tanacetum coccineum]